MNKIIIIKKKKLILGYRSNLPLPSRSKSRLFYNSGNNLQALVSTAAATHRTSCTSQMLCSPIPLPGKQRGARRLQRGVEPHGVGGRLCDRFKLHTELRLLPLPLQAAEHFRTVGPPQSSSRQWRGIVSMELSATGDRVFAAEAILKRRVRKARFACYLNVFSINASFVSMVLQPLLLPRQR